MATATLTVPSAPGSSSAADVIAWQKERMNAGAFEVLGKIWMISLEASKDAQVPGKPVANVLGTRIEFYNEMGGPDVVGPRLAQTGAKGALLILDPIVRQDGVMGLPDIPDPTWKPPIPTPSQISYQPPSRPKNAPKNWRPPKPPDTYVPTRAPMIPQHLIDRGDGFGGRARGQIRAGASTYLVCGPVAQIVVRPMDQQNRILPNGLIFKCLPSSPIAGVQGTLMELLIDSVTGEAFFYGGRFEISNPG